MVTGNLNENPNDDNILIYLFIGMILAIVLIRIIN